MELLTLALRWINLSQTSQTNNHSEVIVRSTPTFSRMISKPSRQQASTLLTMSKTLNHWILISCRALIWADSDLHRDGSWPTGTITVPEQPTLPLFVVIAAAIPVKEYWNPTRHVLQFLRYHEASSHFLVFQILPHHFFFLHHNTLQSLSLPILTKQTEQQPSKCSADFITLVHCVEGTFQNIWENTEWFTSQPCYPSGVCATWQMKLQSDRGNYRVPI